MGQWVEIPCRRVYEIRGSEREEYVSLREDGEPTREGDKIYRVVRKRDGKVFKLASFWPMESFSDPDCRFLEEI